MRVGAAEKFIFQEGGQYSFYNGTANPDQMKPVYARILAIRHELLGDVTEVDTVGLSYLIWLNDDNDVIQVEAEERPGYIECSTIQDVPPLDPLEFTVELEPALPSQVRELDMIAVMLNDDTDFFKWWGYSLEEADNTELLAGGVLHYIRSLLKAPEANAQVLQQVFRFIDKMYAWGNPYMAGVCDENVLLPFAGSGELDGIEEKYLGEEARKSYDTFKKRKKLRDSL